MGSKKRLPRNEGGSASALGLSGPARTSLTLRPAELLDHPRRPLSRGFNPGGCPSRPLVSYPDQSTTPRVAPTSTGDTRIQGALHSITSSARASSLSGIASPSALAVLRLMTSTIQRGGPYRSTASGGATKGSRSLAC